MGIEKLATRFNRLLHLKAGQFGRSPRKGAGDGARRAQLRLAEIRKANLVRIPETADTWTRQRQRAADRFRAKRLNISPTEAARRRMGALMDAKRDRPGRRRLPLV